MVDALRSKGAPVPDDYSPDEPDDELSQWSDTTGAQVSATNADRVGGVFDTLGDAAALATIVGALNSSYDTWTGSGDDMDPQACRASDIAGDATTAGWHYGELDTSLGLEASVTTLVAERTWTSLGDNRTRASHAEADGQTAGTTDTFTVGGDSLRFPCDPDGSAEETCNCRCYLYWSFEWSTDAGAVSTRPVGDIYDNGDAATLGEE